MSAPSPAPGVSVSLPLEEVVNLGAVDGSFYARNFFPRTCRQASPQFHTRIWDTLSGARYVNLLVYREGGKTSLLRLFTSRRIAYSQSHTILWLGPSEPHSIRSVDWIRRQVEFNRPWAQTFGLSKGSKWLGTEVEIVQRCPGSDAPRTSIWLLALGYEGSVRGINLDDWRPDLIIVDDVVRETAASPAERKKQEELIMGAIYYSLAPETEAPYATLAMLNTPQHLEDVSMKASESSLWMTERFSCWTDETQNEPNVDRQESRWPERFPSETLRREKKAALAEKRSSIWYREKEVRIIAPETCSFDMNWLRFYELVPPREEMITCIGIDPVPKPTERQIQTGLHDKDYEVIFVMGLWKNFLIVLEYFEGKGHEPDVTLKEFFRLALKWRPLSVEVDATAYQSTLSWLLSQAMKQQGRYYVVNEITDKRSKFHKITDEFSGISSHGGLMVRKEHTSFIQQFRDYPNTAFDDVLDAAALAARRLKTLMGFQIGDGIVMDGEFERLDTTRLELCP